MATVSPVERRSLSDSVFEQLREHIVEGTFGPGTSLPAERKLCEMLGVNRGALREALKRLQQAGLINVQHGGQTQVMDFHQRAGLDLLPMLMVGADGSVNTEAARGIIELRTAIGEDAARLAALRADEQTVAALAGLLEEMKRAGDDLAARQRLGMAFWQQIILGSKNLAYRLAYNTLMQTYERVAELLTQVLSPEFTHLRGYRDVVRAVTSRNGPAAGRSARKLLTRGTQQLFTMLDDLERTTPSGTR